jgi:hypothetical protein
MRHGRFLVIAHVWQAAQHSRTRAARAAVRATRCTNPGSWLPVFGLRRVAAGQTLRAATAVANRDRVAGEPAGSHRRAVTFLVNDDIGRGRGGHQPGGALGVKGRRARCRGRARGNQRASQLGVGGTAVRDRLLLQPRDVKELDRRMYGPARRPITGGALQEPRRLSRSGCSGRGRMRATCARRPTSL